MSEETKYKVPRSAEEITQEFQQLCFKSGDLQYKIDAYKRDLAMLNEQMRDLNFEFVQRRELDASEAKQKADDEAKAAANLNVLDLPVAKE